MLPTTFDRGSEIQLPVACLVCMFQLLMQLKDLLHREICGSCEPQHQTWVLPVGFHVFLLGEAVSLYWHSHATCRCDISKRQLWRRLSSPLPLTRFCHVSSRVARAADAKSQSPRLKEAAGCAHVETWRKPATISNNQQKPAKTINNIQKTIN